MQERDETLIIQPEYQRGFVWKEPKCSKLVETILLKLPFQEVWLHEQPSGKKEVIDGQQRLTTIKAFKDGVMPNMQRFKLQVGFKILCFLHCHCIMSVIQAQHSFSR